MNNSSSSHSDSPKGTAVSVASQSLKGPSKINILGIEFDNLSRQELLESLKKGFIITPNVDHVMKLRSDPDFVSVMVTKPGE
ncbi:MAG: hypothetical protein AAGL17_20320 [Cyanobacteria bacterium J06576_12]